MRYILIIIIMASSLWGQSPGENFCTEILRIYPAEFVDQMSWWQTCQRTSDLERLMVTLQDPLVKLADTTQMSEVSYQRNEISTTGYLRITGFHGGERFLERFDDELEKARHDDGLLLDLRGAGGGAIATAYDVMARFTDDPLEGVRVYKRLPGEERTVQTAYRVRPRGDWQFDLPVVILVDGGTHWPAQAILWAARSRSQIMTVGLPTAGTKAVEPQIVQLPGRVKVQIPTATVTTVDKVTQIGQTYEPDVNLNKQPLTAHRDARDPILWKATDELYRILGRLEWLREERRKQVEEN